MDVIIANVIPLYAGKSVTKLVCVVVIILQFPKITLSKIIDLMVQLF